MALKVIEFVRRGAWAFLALGLLAPGIASSQSCDPIEVAVVALFYEDAAPVSQPESTPCCTACGALALAAQSQRAGSPTATTASGACEHFPVSPSIPPREACSSAARWSRYCARSARLLR